MFGGRDHQTRGHSSPELARCWKELATAVDITPLFGLGGILIAATTAEFNDQVTSIALADVRGALGISHDAGTWIESLYVSAEIIGMAISPWLLVTFTLRRWTLFAIVPVRNLERADPIQPEHRGNLRFAPASRTRRGPDHPFANGDSFSCSHAEHSALRPGRLRVDCNIHARAGRNGVRALHGYRGLAFHVPADNSVLLSGGRSCLVLSASGSAEIRTVPNAGLARRNS